MKMILATLSLFLVLCFGCSQNVSPAEKEAKSKTVQQLEQELEQALSACNDKLQKTYKADIDEQKGELSKKTITEAEFKNFLAKMKKIIKCS